MMIINCLLLLVQLVERYGSEADQHLFRILLSVVDFSPEGKASAKDEHQIQLLIQETNSVTTKPNFVSVLCFGFEKQTNKVRQRCSHSWPP